MSKKNEIYDVSAELAKEFGEIDYAMSQMQKVFPELQWTELPYSHPIFQEPYSFPDGLPKTPRGREVTELAYRHLGRPMGCRYGNPLQGDLFE